MAAHRFGLALPRRYPDPARSPDPRIRTLVAQLRGLSLAPPMRANFRADLRAQLVALAPRLVAEGVAPPPKPPAGRVSRTRAHHLGRPLAVLATAAAVFVALLGGAVWFSGRTLPGDSLYGIKRASENLQLSFASGDTGRGKEYLDLARTRAEEAVKLWARHGHDLTPQAAPGSRAASLITSTLSDADTDTSDAAQLLTGAAVRTGRTGPLDAVSAWTPGQLHRLAGLLAGLPAGTLHDRVAASANLVQRLAQRASALRGQLGCGCLSSAASDDLGPVPCTSCQAAAPGNPGGAGATSPPGAGLPAAPGVSTAPGHGSAPAPGTPAPGGTRQAGTPPGSHPAATGGAAAPGAAQPPAAAGAAQGASAAPGAGASGGAGATASAGATPPAGASTSAAPPQNCVTIGIGSIGIGLGGGCGLTLGLG